MLKDKKLLPPPWIAYPHIERYSIGWRMGYGEDYIMNTVVPTRRAVHMWH